MSFSLVPGVVLVLADRPYFTTPGDNVTIRRGQPLTFAWTILAGVLQYGFEFTGVDRVFANPNAACA